MLRVVRPRRYNATMVYVNPDFYSYLEREDELTADMLSSHIVRFLDRVPQVAEKVTQQLAQNLSESSRGTEVECTFQTEQPTFQSDSSISSDSSTSSAASLFDSFCKKASKVRSRKPKAKTILPNGLVSRIVRDVIRCCEGEPFGIRGCKLMIELQDGPLVLPLGKVFFESQGSSSCTVVLRLSTCPIPDELVIPASRISRLIIGTPDPEKLICISPGYTIEKIKHKK